MSVMQYILSKTCFLSFGLFMAFYIMRQSAVLELENWSSILSGLRQGGKLCSHLSACALTEGSSGAFFQVIMAQHRSE